MPITNWNTAVIDGQRYLVVDIAKLRIPLDWDPSSNVFLAVCAPDGIDGDALFNHPGLVKGDNGDPPIITTDVGLTVLEYDDPTPDSAQWSELSPNTYKYITTQRKGPQGDTGTVVLHLADDLAGDLTPGDTIIVNTSGNGFQIVGRQVGDWYLAGSVLPTPSGNPTFTMCTIPVPPQKFDWRPYCDAMTIADAGIDITVITDLVARLGSASGNELARCFGTTFKERLILAGGPPTDSPDDWDRVPANTAANILFRVERRSGFTSATTSATTTRCRVKVDPIPGTAVE
jgi:hypothetical protein